MTRDAALTVGVLAVATLTAAACTQKELGATATSIPPADVTATLANAPSSSTPRIIVAGESGLFDLGRDGSSVTRIGTASPARFPRYLPGARSLVFVGGGNTLRRVDLATGKDELIAGPWATSLSCGGSGPLSLEIHADEDVVVDDHGQHACIDLYDRNVNMASAGSSVRIDLVQGTFQQVATLQPRDCADMPSGSSFDCRSAKADAVAGDFPYDFDDASFAVIGPSNHHLGKLSGFVRGASAPGGRWLLLWGNQEDGDYIHRHLLVLDRLAGTVIAVPSSDAEGPVSWPAPLNSVEMAHPSREQLASRAGDFVSEMAVHFIGRDILVAHKLLMNLELRRVSIVPGDVAR